MTEPTDNELDIVLSKHWPAFATVGALPLIWIRAAFREAIAKWCAPQPVIPSDAEIDDQWRESVEKHETTAAFVRDFARAVLAKWGTLRAEKIVIPTDTMEQELQKHYRRGYEAGKKAVTQQPTQLQAGAITPRQSSATPETD